MPEPRDECRPVELPSGEVIRVRGRGELGPDDVAALGELVEAVRRRLAAEQPPDPEASALYLRVEASPGSTGIGPRTLAKRIGIRPGALGRLLAGVMPDPGDVALIEAWLAAHEPSTNTEKENP